MTTQEFIAKLVADYIRDEFRRAGRILNEHAARAELLCAAKMHFHSQTKAAPGDENGFALSNPVMFDAYGFEPEIHGGPWMVKVFDRFGNSLASAVVDSDAGFAVMD